MRKFFILTMLGSLFFLSATSSGAFVYEDDFNDNSIDSAKWTTLFGGGTVELRESSSVLQFQDTGGSSDEMILLGWNQAFPDDESWIATIDVSIPFGLLDTSSDEDMYLTMGLRNINDHSDTVSIDYEHSISNNTEVARFIVYKQTDGADMVDSEVSTTETTGSLIIEWVQPDRHFKIGYGVAGSSAVLQEVDVNDWNLGSGDPFELGIGFGIGNGLTIDWSDGVFEDNFSAFSDSSAVPEPTAVSLFLFGIGFFIRRFRKSNSV